MPAGATFGSSVSPLDRFPTRQRQSRAGNLRNREPVERIRCGPQTGVRVSALALARDPLNASYSLGKGAVRLEQGFAETLIVTGSAVRERTWVVGEPVSGDLDGDGDEDSALILAQNSGGSGTFYYVVAAREQRGAYLGSNGVLLGDRIRLEEISVVHGLVIVRYRRRGAGDPMASIPTIPTTTVLRIEQGKLAALATVEAGE